MRSRSLPIKLGALSMAAIISLAACGSDGDSSPTASEDTTTTEAMAEEAGTIVDVAAGNEDFSTLVEAVTAADLAETLSGEGPFTVFAPTNDAFAALPEGTLDTLLDPANKDQLADILTYHVVAGKVMAADLTDGQEIETVQGGTLTVGIDGDTVTLTDENGNTATVTTADLEASNGVIHVIDAVVTPAAEDAEGDAAASGTIVDVASGNEDFSTLVTAVGAAELAETLSGEGPFTVFAPTNEAFEALPAGTLDTLLDPANKDQLAAILTYHAVAGKVMAADLTDGQQIETVQGGTLTVGIDGDTVTLTDENGGVATITATDIEASNGVIHVIDTVVTPAS